MPLPGKLNLKIYQGDSFNRDFLVEEIVDGEQVPVDFTAHEVSAFVRPHSSSNRVLAVFNITWPLDGEDEDRYGGIFNAALSSRDTAKLPADCVYDIQSYDTQTEEYKTWVYGRIMVIRGDVTRV